VVFKVSFQAQAVQHLGLNMCWHVDIGRVGCQFLKMRTPIPHSWMFFRLSEKSDSTAGSTRGYGGNIECPLQASFLV
jgi:hypothetical protein